MKSFFSKIQKRLVSSFLFSRPLGITVSLAIALSAPYLIFFDYNSLLVERLFSCAAFAFLVVFTQVIIEKRTWLISLSCFLTFIFVFIGNYEIGNYLVKGDTFGIEFWQFIGDLTKNTILLPLQTTPLLTLIGVLGPFCLSFILFFALKNMVVPQKRVNNIFITAVLVVFLMISGSLNFYFSSASSLAMSYTSFTGMKDEIEQARYTRTVPTPNEVTALKGKNILHIILESFGDIYTNNERFPGLAPNLARYKQQGLWSANMIQTPNQANSFMGHFVTDRGRFYFIAPSEKKADVGLGFILKKAGYKNVFIRGAGADMAGPFSQLYSPRNGYHSFYASHNLQKKYDKNHVSGFGFSDEILFTEALEQYQKLVQSDTPFRLTLFTLDMHGFPQGISRICQDKYQYTGPFDKDELVQGAHCTDTLVHDFISQISKLPRFDDLVIVIHSDHVQHNVTPAVAPDSQRIYSVIMGTDIEPFKQEKETHLMDMAPTILSQAGIKTNAKFYAGDDFSGELVREPILDRELEVKDFSNRISYEMFSVIEPAPEEDVLGSTTEEYEDRDIEISYTGFEGAIFSSHYFFVENKTNFTPYYVLYPAEDEIPKVFRPRKGMLLQKYGSNAYTVGVRTGKLSHWSNALLEDLVSGNRWKIGIDQRRIVKLPQVEKNELKQVTKREVFRINNGADFTGLNQVKYKGDNSFEVQGGDSQVFFEMDLSKRRPHIVEIEISSEHDDIAKLYYEINDTLLSELNVSSAYLKPGVNKINLYLPQGVYRERFRFDMGEKTGAFRISSFIVYSLRNG